MPNSNESFDQIDARVRDAFPETEGLSGERTMAMYERLRAAEPTQAAEPQRPPRRAGLGVKLALAAAVLAAIGGGTLFASAPKADAPQAASVVPVPQLALAALDSSSSVVHYTSVETKTKPSTGEVRTREELWFAKEQGVGRLVEWKYDGETIVETSTLVADERGATRLIERAGEEPKPQTFDGKDGAWWRELDKVATYRNMLESDVATVTGEGVHEGEPTHKLEAVMADTPAPGYEIRMVAEIRKADYLPVSVSSEFIRLSDGKVLVARNRVYESFELVPFGSLPAGFFSSLASSETTAFAN